MNTALWVTQALLALAFLGAGSMKLMKTRAELIAMPPMGWAEDFSANTIKLIGVAEIAGALGLILPTVTGVLPVLTSVAAGGLVLVMLGAAAIHIKRSEMGSVPPTLVLMGLSAFVAYGQFVA